MKEYDIYMGKERVGQALVHKEGLYYTFRCKCELQSGIICRVLVSCGKHYENLGILVPEGEQYILKKRIPIKQFENGRFEFQVFPGCQKRRETFLRVYPEEPFRYIRMLQNAYMEFRRGEVGIVLQMEPGSNSNSSSTGQ